MVKKKLLIILGASSGLGKELLPKLNKKYQIIAFYNKGTIKTKKNINKIKLDFNSDLFDLEIKLKKYINNYSDLILLNLAAIKIDKISYYISEKDFNTTFKINTFAFLRIIQCLIPIMIKNKWGRIINISSVGALRGYKGTLLYSASKHANEAIINVMSKEYGKFNIFFNTLILGNFNFGLFKKLDHKMQKNLINQFSTKKTGKPINIIKAIDLLADTDYINGSSITIDGGSE